MNEMQSRFEPDLDETGVNDIAVIGIAGRFPGASNPREFWENLKGGVNAFRRFSAEEIEDTFGAAVRGGSDYVPVRPHLDNVDQFDAEFFGMLPREAKFTDPQQRVFLECCWEALEDAGYDPATYAGPIGVFAGSSFNSYLLKHVCGDREGIDRFTSDYQVNSYQELLGALPEFLPTRVCYRFNLTGPGVNVQSACSTSLLAIAQACQSLLMYTSDMVLAGGVSITFPQKRGYVATEGAMVSPDGNCRPFDADASGTVFGSGAGVILLKRLADAKADGDHIYGVIRGFGINNDGSGKAGFTAPSVEGQAAVIVQAHAMAGINAREIGYIECHGTATPLGDPIEFAGLERAFREGTDDRGFCVLGSAKGNIGHLDAAAGVTGVIKTLLTLKHERIPPLAGYTKPNPHIDLESSPFTITGTAIDWPRGNAPRIAGVSAFGVGGTNVHLVIEEAPAEQRVESKANAQLLLLSARSPGALAKASQNLADRLASAPDTDLADVAWTLQRGRRRFKHRKAVVATDRAAAITALAGDAPERVQDAAAPEVAPAVHMMFPGQGAQYVGMGADLYAREPQFRTAIDRCADVLTPLIGIDLRLFMQPCTADDAQALQDKLKDTAIAQPAIFAIEYALASLWMSWGISPKAMVGHSVGEFAAATIAGIFELQDALALVAERGRLMHDVERGSMLSVRLSEQDVLARLPGTLSIAAVNAPTVTVVAGPTPEIEAFEAALSAEKITTRRLVTSHAFHSAMMDPVVDVFRKVVEGVPRRAPRIPILSTLTGDWMTDAEAIDPGYWARHVRMPVRFSAAVQKLRQDAGAALLEVGPGNTLNALSRLHAGTQGQVIAASLGGAGATEPDGEAMMSALGTLWLSGIEPDWVAVHGAEARDRRRIPLPTYPFERKRHWIDLPAAVQVAPVPAQTVPVSPIPLESSKDVPSMANDTTAQTVTVPRRDRIHAAIVALFEDLSGKSLGDAPQTASFLELGFDSLFLTQATRELQNKIGIKVVFRQLLGDLGSLEALARFADEKLPADKFAELKAEAPAPAAAPAPQAATSATSSAPAAAPAMLAPIAQTTYQLPDGASALERVMREQLQVMSHLMATQIGALTGVPAAPAIAPATIQPQVLGTQPMLPGPTPAVPLPASAAIAAPAATPPAKPAAKQDFQAFGPYKPLNTAHVATSVAAQQEKIAEIIARYTQRTAKSKALTQQYRKPLADPRVVSGFRENWKEMVYPVITNRSKGSRLWDVDGNEYIDILNGFGPIMFGHRPDFLERAVEQQLHDGFEIGPQSPLAGEIAQMFCEMTGNERMTFCNTGSEAVMAALRVARTVTGRDKVLSFAGDYHGMFDEVLIKAAKNKDGTPSSNPIAPGIPRESVANMIVMDYGTPETLEWIRANAHDLAAVMVEPFQSRRPHFKPIEWLKEVREITRKSNTALVFDEVVTGFRVHPGGAQAAFGIRADMATYGKVLGGGMPIGVLAGTSEFLDALDGGQWQFGDDSVPEVGVTFFAGTFVRHPLALAAVKAVLEELKRQGPELQERLTRRTEQMVARINAVLERYGIPTRINSSYSVMYFSFPSDEKYASLFYYLLREHGVHVLEGFPCFMTTAHSDADIDHIVSAFEKAASEMRGAGLVSGEMLPGVTLLPIEKAPVAPAPLTEPQREIFLAAMLGDDVSCAFNESLSVRLTGNLDVSALTTAVDAVVQRHDALRATIDEDGATFVVAPELKVALEHIDLSARAESDRDAELDRLLDGDARTAFDLANGPLIRGFLVKMEANEHVLVLTMHHIVCDGWSCNVILGDIAELYSAAIERRDAVLDPVMSFAAFARSQAARSRAEQADMEAYWLDQFKTVPPLVELPTDRPREDARTYNGTTHRRHIAKEQLERIRQLGARNGASLFATLFTGFNALVARLSGQNDIVVGVPTAGQSLLDGGALVGHCVNFLPMRTAIAPNATFVDLLAQVKETVLDAYDHQDFTYGTLVQRLDIKRDPSRLPLTELQFNLEQVGSGATFAGLASAVEANAKGAVNSDLFLNIVESADGLALDCDYNTDLFDAATIDAWLAGLETLLMGAAADPAQPISALPVPEAISQKESAPLRSLTAADFDRLAAWNATDAAYPKESSVVALFEAQVARTPHAVALTQGEARLSYADLNDKANHLANYLVGLGAGPGQLVGICLDRTPEMLVALLAVLKSGAAYLPLDPTYPSDRIAFMLEDGQAKLLVTQEQHVNLVPHVNVTRVLVDGDRAAIEARSAANPSVSIAPESPAYVIYTSGSTGKPKGVAVPHRALVNFLHSMRREPGLTEADVLAAVTTISFDIAGLELYLPLITGARIELVTRDAAADGAQLVQVLEASGATVLQATPATWRLLIDAGWTGSKTLRALCGGEALPRDLAGALLQRVGQLWNMYGPTETTIWSTVERIESAEGVITIGRPIANTQIHILDEAGQHLPAGVDGEIWIGGDGVAIGYRGRPELTAERFVPDRFSGRENARLYRTGDYGRWLEDGRLQHLGRVDHQVKIRGYRIELEEIEAVLQQVPGVKQACVVAEKDGEVAGRLVAFCIPVAHGSLVLEKILAHLKQHLPSFMVPASFVNVDSFPLTANGKLDRLKLLEIEHQRRAERVQIAAESAEERKLLDIVKEVMRMDRIGVTDNLFEIGADSLRIFQIASRAAKAGLSLTPRAILQGRTIRSALAQAAATPGGASAGLTIKPAVRQRVRLVPVADTNGTAKS